MTRLLLPLLLLAALPQAELGGLGREVVQLVRERFLDAERAARWGEAHARYAEALPDRAAFDEATRRALAALKTSHTAWYTREDRAYYDLLAIFEPRLQRDPRVESLGMHAVELGGAWHVARIFPGSPAERAGLRRGDRIVSADGEPFHPLRSLRGKNEVAFQVQSRPDEPRREFRVTPRRVHPKEEWLEAQRAGTRVQDWKGSRIGYAPLWSCAGPEHRELLEEALADDLKDAEALVLDLRGGWGGCDPSFLHLFNPAAPELTRIDRSGKRSLYAPSWRKPLAVLIDGGSRSGKEVVARAIQRHRLGVLVGERTAGAVLAGQPFLLSDGSLLFLAVEDILVDGEHLEGTGVNPDIPVPASLPYAEGRDPQLETAFDHLAAGLAK